MFCTEMHQKERNRPKLLENGHPQQFLTYWMTILVTFFLHFFVRYVQFFIFQLAAAEKSLIRVALNRIQKPTCIKFDRIFYSNSTKDYIHIKASKSGCGTNVGFRTGIQIIHLQENVKSFHIFSTK